MKRLKTIILTLVFGLFASLLLFNNSALAYQDSVGDGIRIVDNYSELTNEDPRFITGRFIMIALSFLGIIAVIVIIYAGFQWMTSGGNQERVASSKKMLIAGLIGLLIILLSLAITRWLIFSVANEVII
jgi:hypothetical protein